MKTPNLLVLCALLVLLSPVFGACNGEDGGAAAPRAQGGGGGSGTFVGTWHVVTKLVAASEATNPDYKPGHLREERWVIAVNGGQATLTSPAGTIPGTVGAGGFVFEGAGDTGLNLRLKAHVEGAFDGPKRIVGTIKVQYYGTFNNYVGFDAWQFEGRR